MFDMILIKRFEKRPGHQKMLRREFAIEEGHSGRELSRSRNILFSLRPGEKIDMSMIFQDNTGKANHCPRCGADTAEASGLRIQWYHCPIIRYYWFPNDTDSASCKVWFQRVTEIEGDAARVISSDGHEQAGGGSTTGGTKGST